MKNLSINFNSWFDYWHTHFFQGSKNKIYNFKERKKYIDEMFETFEYAKKEVSKYKNKDEFQVFCILSINDPFEDSLYIHTKNPNSDNFPIVYRNNNEMYENELIEYIKSFGYRYFIINKDTIIIYDYNFGCNLENIEILK